MIDLEGAGPDEPQREDHIVQFYDVSWSGYEAVLALQGEKARPKIAYLDGVLELMSPSFDHERISGRISRLLEWYCTKNEIDFVPCGEWTIKKRRDERGAQADQSYYFSDFGRKHARPDVVIEVIWTSGGLDKLDLWRKLGVREVWVWRKGTLQAFRLHGLGYRAVPRSRFVPDLDLDLLARYVDRPSFLSSLRAFRRGLARRQRKAH